jgi:glucuronate isomerase
MPSSPTIYDVARHARVAASTVSRALRDPGRVSARTREAVLASVAEVGYVPALLARAEPPRRARTLLVAVSDIANPYYAPLIKAAQTRAAAHGYTLALTDSDESPHREAAALHRLLGSCGGAVLATSRLADRAVVELARHRPLVLVNRVVPGLPALVADTGAGMRAAVRHLADLGHRRIAYLSGPANSWANAARWASVSEEAAELGAGATLVGPFPPTRRGGQRAAEALLGLPEPASAAIAYNDLMAIGVLERLLACGVAVPGSISLVGCDDVFGADLTAPALTTVAVPTAELGRAAVDALHRALTEAVATPPAPRWFPTRLVKRDSVAMAPGLEGAGRARLDRSGDGNQWQPLGLAQRSSQGWGMSSRVPLLPHPDRLLPAEPAQREVARRLLRAVADLPLISPHGHVDPALLASDTPFTDPASLLVTPDHYVTRLLHAHGVPLERLGLGDPGSAPPREVWRTFCEHWPLLVGTATRQWLEAQLHDVLGVRVHPAPDTADELFDELTDRLAEPGLRPRALYETFRLDVLATTDDPADDLRHHRALADDPDWKGRVLPTFRPDAYLNAGAPGWPGALERLAASADVDTGDYQGLVAALESRRRHFAELGATATDHSAPDAGTEFLDAAQAGRLYQRVRAGSGVSSDAHLLSRQLLGEMARMSAEDGLVMALHCGVRRNHHPDTLHRFGPDTGHDIPLRAEFTDTLRPMLARFGTHPRFRLVLFTLDETVYSRELAPLAGFYPSVWLGAPWWFLDAPRAMRRFRDAVTETAGFYRCAGFVDDTRGFTSIPARHDTARRVDAAYLAGLVAEHVLTEENAATVLRDLHDRLPREAFRLGED